MKHHAGQFTHIFCLLTVLSILSISPAPATEHPIRVLILPLTIHSEKDLTFLNKGIMDMMVSRISQSATVIRRTAVDQGKDIVQMGGEVNADYVVSGSLTLFGKDVSTDALLTRVDTGETALQFSRLGQDGGDVLKNIDQFTTEVSHYLDSTTAGGQQIPSPTAAVPVVISPKPSSPVKPVSPPAPAASVAPVPTPEVPATQAAPPKNKGLWTSNPFKGTISALATADVDGDGRIDIVVAHGNKIVVQTKDGQRLSRLAVFDAGKRHTIISLDAGDINGNTKSEIFVTRRNAQGKLDGVVLEWNGTSLAPIAAGQRLYFRIITDPETGPMLIGQRPGTPMSNDTGGLYADPHFLPGVFELTWTGKAFRTGRRLPIPKNLNIYWFTRGDIFNDGSTRTIAYSPMDELRISDPAGSPQWAGKETFGGSPMFLKAPSLTDGRSKDRTYLAQRLVVADLDNDGNMEVVTAHNRDAVRGLVERFRNYTRGRMIALSWNQVNMKTIWSGEEIGGYISDFSLVDLNGDGKLEAVYAIVTNTGLTQSKSSNIVVEQIGELSVKDGVASE